MEAGSLPLLEKKQQKKNQKLASGRQRTQARFEALLNPQSDSEDRSEANSEAKLVKKKKRSKTSDGTIGRTVTEGTKEDARPRSLSEENLLTAAPGKNTQGESKKSKSALGAAKKKKKNLSKRSEVEKDVHENGEANEAYENVSNVEIENEGVERVETEGEIPQRQRRKKRRDNIEPKTSTADRIVQALEKKRSDDGLLLCIVVHKADQLKPDIHVTHPVIRLHIVDMNTGQYVKKTDRLRNVASVFENKNENIDFIMPMMTQPFDFRKNRSLTPYWEEVLLYNEIYSYFLSREDSDPPVIIFFELLDFIAMDGLNKKLLAQSDKGWYRIAWAFLKLVSPCGITNTDKKIRLQFFNSINRMRSRAVSEAGIEIYQWWKNGTRTKYPSTLYVTVKGVKAPENMAPSTRSMFAMQEEKGGLTFDELNQTVEGQTIRTLLDTKTQFTWTKLPGQVNRIPNKLHLKLHTAQKGCSVVRFSQNGRYLACACTSNNTYPLLIYEFPSGKHIATLSGHFGLIYDLAWSANGRELLSASADTTVRVWDVKRFSSNAIKVFPHPEFVYVACYHPQNAAVVVTGSFDSMLRVWNKLSDEYHAQLLRELSGHAGYVNAVVFRPDGTQFFSGDSEGYILQWNCNLKATGKKEVNVENMVNQWKVARSIDMDELKMSTINTLCLHPAGQKLLVHSRDSMIRMLDLRSYGIMRKYAGGSNFKEHIHATLSTCGSFVFCGTEEGVAHVWNTETGDCVFTYNELGFTRAVSDVCFHPHDNYIAFCCNGANQTVCTYQYDPKVIQVAKPSFKKEGMSAQQLSQDYTRSIAADTTFNDTMESLRSVRTAAAIADDTKRMDTINKKLMSVTTPRGHSDDLNVTKNRVTFRDTFNDSPIPTYAGYQDTSQGLSTWGSDFSHTAHSPTFARPLSSSPHAQLHLGSSGRFFSKRGSLRSPQPDAGMIEMQLNDNPMSLSELQSPRPVFTFNSTTNESQKSPRGQRRKVIALYEYRPNRADELWLHVNDEVTVLYEDNPNWWMGQLDDGRQGYFPVNYVMEPETDHVVNSVVSQHDETDGQDHTAIVDEEGNFKVVSGPVKTGTKKKKLSKGAKKKKESEKKNLGEELAS